MAVLDQIPTIVLEAVSTDAAWQHIVVPFQHSDGVLHVYSEQNNSEFSDEHEIITGERVQFELVNNEELKSLLNTYYPRNIDQRSQSQLYNQKADDFVDVLIEEAKKLNSSDIHIEAFEDFGKVRIRIDGKLIERYSIDMELYPTLINKIKIKARLDIAEKRLPQDGRIEFNEGDVKVDIRVSILPTLHGEKVVMRLLGSDAADIDLHTLGFQPQELERYLEGVKRPSGILLISGPTGSGKTTSLYATLKLLNQPETNIITVEDPIEYTLEGINQVQLKEDIGLNFNTALKSFLRQDPDVIMLGEIRDPETANMAIRAALTGHLVLSTIHTNSAWATVNRLKDMGIAPFLIASTLNTSVAQRLVRKLCNQCKKEVQGKPEDLPAHFKPPFELQSYHMACGCDQCYHTGYSGRKAVYEVINIDNDLSDLIKTDHQESHSILKEKKINSLADNAYQLLANGTTTIEEIYPLLLNAN